MRISCTIQGGKRMWNLIKREYTVIFTKRMEIVLFILFLPVVMLLIDFSEKWIYMIANISIYYLSLSLYSENDTDILYYSMPIKKYNVVLSRYIMFFVNYLIITVYIYLTSFILLKLNFVDRVEYLNTDFLKLLLFSSLIAVCVALPILFSLRYETSMRFIGVVLVLLINSANYIYNRHDADVERISLSNNTMIILIALIAIAFSILFSLNEYTKKEF